MTRTDFPRFLQCDPSTPHARHMPAQHHTVLYIKRVVAQLRRKIEPNSGQPRYILDEPGVGYRLQVDDQSRNRHDAAQFGRQSDSY